MADDIADEYYGIVGPLDENALLPAEYAAKRVHDIDIADLLGPEDEDDIRPAYAAAQGQNSSIARKEPVVRVAKKHPADRKTAAGIKKQKKKSKRSHAVYPRKESDMQMQDRGLSSFAIPRNLYKVGVREEVTRMTNVTCATDTVTTTMSGDNNERSTTDVEDVVRQLDRLRT